MMVRDINNYDYLSVSVKSAQIDRILLCYRALGWSEVKREDDKKYYDMKYLLLSRPHKIQNKDRLQYLQVRMETKINEVSRIDTHRHFDSIALIILQLIIAVAMLGGGLYFLLGVDSELSFAIGITLCALSAVFFVSLIYPLTVMRKRENKLAASQIKDNLQLVEKYLQEARSLSLANVESSADIISVLGGNGNEAS